jgi:hypothetical protein
MDPPRARQTPPSEQETARRVLKLLLLVYRRLIIGRNADIVLMSTCARPGQDLALAQLGMKQQHAIATTASGGGSASASAGKPRRPQQR